MDAPLWVISYIRPLTTWTPLAGLENWKTTTNFFGLLLATRLSSQLLTDSADYILSLFPWLSLQYDCLDDFWSNSNFTATSSLQKFKCKQNKNNSSNLWRLMIHESEELSFDSVHFPWIWWWRTNKSIAIKLRPVLQQVILRVDNS